MTTNRRDFLKLASLGAAVPSVGLLPRVLHAATPTETDRYFVFAYFSGGWDVLLSLDPRDPDVFTSQAAASTGIQPAYDQLRGLDESDFLTPSTVEGMTFGPYIGALADPVVGHADKLAVVRGMTMESVAHQVARRHVLTGIRPAGTAVRASSVATLLAFLLGEDEPIPNLVAGLASFNIGHPLWASGLPTNSIEDLHTALSPPETDLLESQRDALEAFFAKQEARASTQRARDIYANRSLARALIDSQLGEYFNIDSTDSEMVDLRGRFGIDSGETGEGGYMALMAAQALTKGISRCVTIRVADGLDSHQGSSWTTDHGPRQREGFNAIAALATHLEQTPFKGNADDNWLNHTTIVCFSEFSREPLLNSNGGRDHSLINSMVLLGAGIKGGQVLGASTDLGMLASPVDLASGAVSPTGELVGNNHIARTLLHSIGIDDDIGDFRVDPFRALLVSP
ncbi:MAG: DUF1501 domain-containing protein [Myxococcota bacterium]|nr:DUF1501 domain-containing protein [Myxococcota bacterium]